MRNKIFDFLKMPLDNKIDLIIRKIIAPIDSRIRWNNRLGKNSLIRKPVMIHGKKFIQIGEGCTIRSGARIEAISKWNDFNYLPQLIIGNNVTAEENLHIACAEKIEIGHDVTISFDVMIMDNEHEIVKDKKIFENPLITSPVSIGDYTFIGAGVKILKGVTIGKNCVIGTGAVVTKEIPDNSIAVGIPAKVIKSIDNITKGEEA